MRVSIVPTADLATPGTTGHAAGSQLKMSAEAAPMKPKKGAVSALLSAMVLPDL